MSRGSNRARGKRRACDAPQGPGAVGIGAKEIAPLSLVHTLTFDALGTILDLGGSHAPRLAEFLKARESNTTAGELWAKWRTAYRVDSERPHP